MKITFSYSKKSFVFCVLMFLCHFAHGQVQSVFHALPTENNTHQFGVAFACSDTIPLNNMGTIYSFSIDAAIHQPQEASLTLIVLEDTDGHEYVVAESSWFRFDTTEVYLNHYCEETAILGGVTPAFLKCYLTGEANVTITDVYTSSQPATNNTDTIANYIKEEQTNNIVDRINDYNTRHRRLWEAAVTDVSLHFYQNKKEYYNDGNSDAYSSNMQYYSKGLFEIGEPRAYSASMDSSLFVPSFDWRNRHGKCWLTPSKSQGKSAYCVPFAAVSMLESNMLLHYNGASSIDLSEQYVASYCGISYSSGCFDNDAVIRFLKTDGTINEDSMKFEDRKDYIPPAIRPEGNEHVYLYDYDNINSDNISLDTLKKYIINRGPGVYGYRIQNEGGHAMTLAGYGTITPGTTYLYIDGHKKDTICSDADSLVGRTFWIYKNNLNPEKAKNKGYMYVIYHDVSRWSMAGGAFFPKGTPSSNVSRTILCEDLDGDGYFNWGVGSPHIPVWAQSDGDDSDSTIGHMNEYGYCENLPADHPTYEYIYNDSTLTTFECSSTYLGVLHGATVTLHTQPFYANGTKILLDRGATLVIDGFTVNLDFLQPYPGSRIVLRGRAKIQKPFESPLGVELVIEEGSIE